MAIQNADDATPASSSFFDLDFLELGGELTDDSNVIVRARAKFTLFGKAYDATLDVDVMRLVDSFVDWVLEQFPSVDGVVRDIKATFDAAENLFADTWRELKDTLSPAALKREGDRVFRELKGATGADVRGPLSLAVSGDGRHLWAFDVEGRIAYKAGIGLDAFWQDVPGPESVVYGRSKINSMSVSHDGQHVWCVTNGGYVFHRAGLHHSWGQISTGMVTNHDMRGVTVSGDGSLVWAIDDALFHALGEDLRNGDGGEIIERTGVVNSANADEEDLWMDVSVPNNGGVQCARQPGNDEDECGLGVQGAANYDGSVYWMVTRQGAPWYYNAKSSSKKWVEVPRPSYAGGRRRLLLVEEKEAKTPVVDEDDNKLESAEEEEKNRPISTPREQKLTPMIQLKSKLADLERKETIVGEGRKTRKHKKRTTRKKHRKGAHGKSNKKGRKNTRGKR